MNPIKLDDLQLKVMKVLWQKGEATVVEIQEALKKNRDFALTTIATVLKRLHKKEIVDYRKAGRQFIYFPLISEKQTQNSMAGNLVDQLFEGKSSVLVNHLLEAGEFDAQELEALRKLIEQAQQSKTE